MGKIKNSFLSARDKFTPKKHIVIVEHLLKTKENKRFKQTGYSRYIYQKKLDKACFQHNMAYGDFKYLPTRRASDKVLFDKTFDNAENPKHDGN